jgi:hypothetical protein
MATNGTNGIKQSPEGTFLFTVSLNMSPCAISATP